MKFYRQIAGLRGLSATILALALLWSLTASGVATEPEPLAQTDRHAKISRLVTTLFERSHYRQIRIDDEISSQVLDRFIENLDGNRHYFMASDIAEFETYRYSLDDAVKRGDLDAVFEIYVRYMDRTKDRLNYSLTLLEEEPDFTIDERYIFDRSELDWAATQEEIDEIWRLRVKSDALSLILAGREWEEAQDLLSKRYNRVLKRVDQVNSDDAFESFMNAYSHTLDPHSSYFSPRNSEEYRIQMSLSYDGIGASLQIQDDYVSVLNIIPGGPASIEGSLKPEDRIISVAQGEEGEMIDVVGWRLDDVVDLIRGPGGTIVRLQLLPAGAAPGSAEHELALTRDKIKLEAQAAKSSTMEVPNGDQLQRIGVIEVPSFYQDYNARAAGEENYTSTTADVKRLIQELQQDGIDGLVLDLRNNGGGHLSEATALTGLFIDRGPVVQLRDTNGRIEILPDPIPEKIYDGPLTVLVNRYSASASEIFAAAIQDYNRGVIVGQQTFGKGTVQNLYPLDRYAPGRDPRFGQLTLTIGKYYRVNGGSTQHRGVTPDITLPSSIDDATVGESNRESALPWDQIKTTQYKASESLAAAVAVLQQNHEQRTDGNADFDYLVAGIEDLNKQRASTSVSLSLESRLQEREDAETRQLDLTNQRRATLGLEPVTGLEELRDDEVPDVLLDVAAAIVADMSNLSTETMARVDR